MKEYTKERAMAWLDNNWNHIKSCPICRQNNWAVSESLTLLPRLVRTGQETAGGLVYPHFLVTCGTCGYTLFFNALVAGLFPQPPQEEQKES